MAGSICSTSTPATVELMSSPASAPPWVRVGTCRTGDGSVCFAHSAELDADVDIHTGDGHIDLEVLWSSKGNSAAIMCAGKVMAAAACCDSDRRRSIRLEKYVIGSGSCCPLLVEHCVMDPQRTDHVFSDLSPLAFCF